MKLTRNGIAYNLHISPHKLVKVYNGLEVVYVFSSKTYIPKFDRRSEEARKRITESLTKRFGVMVDNDVLSDLIAYSKLERRGFLIIINGEEHTCLNSIKLSGVNQIQKN